MAATTMVKEWSSAPRTTVVGERPGPEMHARTIKQESRTSDIRVINPLYKSHVPNGNVMTDSPLKSRISTGNADYKEERTQDHYKLRMLEPKVDSHAHLPVHASTLPPPRRKPMTRDFPSTHSKRSFLKLDPMEQRKVKSVETRPITTTDYLTESLTRHREMVVSPLKEYLEVKEKEVNKPWEKPSRPGHKLDDPLEGLLYKSSQSSMMKKSRSLSHVSLVDVGDEIESDNQGPKINRSRSFELDDSDPWAKTLLHSQSMDSLNYRPTDFPRSRKHSRHGSVKRKILTRTIISARNAQQREYTPVLYEEQKVIFENEPKPSGAVSERTNVHRVPERVVFENSPQPHNAVGHFTSNRFGMPPQTYDNEPVLMQSDSENYGYVSDSMAQNDFAPIQPRTNGNVGYLKGYQQANPSSYAAANAPKFVSVMAMNNAEQNTTPYSVLPAPLPQLRNSFAPSPPPKPKLSGAQLEFYKSTPTTDFVSTNHNEQSVVFWPPPPETRVLRSTPVPKSIPHDQDYLTRLREQRMLEQEAILRKQQEFLEQRRRQEIRLEQERRALLERQQMQRHVHMHPEYKQDTKHLEPSAVAMRMAPNGHAGAPRPNSDLFLSPGGTSWHRTYQVQTPRPDEIVRNRISSSDDVLDDEAYYIDILARRDAFVERPQPPTEIQRLGKTWKPPPEKPYRWPERKGWRQYLADDDGVYKWVPHLLEPEFKFERKNFTPDSSPPHERSHSPLPGTLDAVNQRQLRGMVMPSSYRRSATPAIDGSMQVRMRVLPGHEHTHSLTASDTLSTDLPTMSPTPQYPTHIRSNDLFTDKIYELPPHVSTITAVERPTNTGVQRKVASLEGRRPVRLAGTSTGTLPQKAQHSAVQRGRAATLPAQTHHNVPTKQSHRPDQNPPRRLQSNQLQSYSIPAPPPSMDTIPPKKEDLEQLSTLRERLIERAKQRHTDFKLTKPDIQKEEPEFEPHPPVPGKERMRLHERLDSRLSNLTTSSTPARENTSGDITDVSTATWQFTSHNSAFSPRSVISINGHSKEDEGLLRVRTDLSPLTQTLNRSNAGVQTQTNIQHQQHQQQQQVGGLPFPYMQAVLVPINTASTLTTDRKVERFNSLPVLNDFDGNGQSTQIQIKDERARKPRSIMKTRRELESKEAMLYPSKSERNIRRWSNEGDMQVQRQGPNVKETVEKMEETKRTEEVERTVRSKEKKHKKHGSRHRSHHHSSHGGGGYYQQQQQAIDNPPWTLPIGYSPQSHSSSRRNSTLMQNGYAGGHQPLPPPQPQISEGYMRQTSTRRMRDHSMDSSLNRFGRQGSLSDSLRRGELKYIPNGELRERRHSSRPTSVHKSQSHRDIYHHVPINDDHYNYGYQTHDSRRGPIVEYPPTLPRDAPAPPPHRNLGVHKSRSFADWEEPRSRDWTVAMGRFQNDMSRLERDFHDSLLMPMPAGNVNEKEYRQENLPGGHESLSKEVTGQSGTRPHPNDPNANTMFNEGKHEMHYKRETTGRR